MGPVVIGRLIKTIPAAQHDQPLEADRFSAREIVAHLADWEPILLKRIKQAVERPGSMCEPHDEGQMAVDNGYAASDIFVEARKWQTARQVTLEYIATLTPEDAKKILNHPERGPYTVEDWVGMLLGHDMYHVEQLSAYLEDRVVSTW